MTAPGSIIAAIIDTHRTTKDANEPSSVAGPMSMPLIWRMATAQQVTASPIVAASAVAVAADAAVGSLVARAGAMVGGASMALPLRGRAAAVGANGAARSNDREAVEVDAPTLAVVGDSLGRKTAVHEADAGLAAFSAEADLDRRRARWDGVARLVPAKGEDHLVVGHDLYVLASRRMLTGDVHPVDAAGARVELGLGAVPLDDLVGTGEVLEDRRRAGVDHDLAYEVGHQCLSFRRSAVSAASRRRSKPVVQ